MRMAVDRRSAGFLAIAMGSGTDVAIARAPA
jgi:hypothetical protein